MTPEQAYWDAHKKNGGPPDIEDMDPIVGFEYNCLTALDVGRGDIKAALLPNPHEDNDHFNCTIKHYHYDSRFEIVGPFAYKATGRVKHDTHTCERTTPPPFPATWGQMGLYADYGRCIPKCGVCPHKGLPIQNGTCSGHRIMFNKFSPPFHITHKDRRWDVADIWADNQFSFGGPLPLGDDPWQMWDALGVLVAEADMPVECRVDKNDIFHIHGRCK